MVGSVFRGAKTANFADVELEGQIKVSESRAGSDITACLAFLVRRLVVSGANTTSPLSGWPGQEKLAAAQDDVSGRH